jgi:hypothetical protein
MDKQRMTAIRIVTVFILILTAGAGTVAAKPQPKEAAHPIAGIWTNPDYNGQGRSARVSYKSTGGNTFLYNACDNADGSGDVYTGKVIYKKTWKNAKGYRYGLSTVTLSQIGMSWETLDRISPDGKTLEVQPGVKEINPKGARYSVYKRLN